MAWDESKHPRDTDGRFSENPHERDEKKRDAVRHIYDSDAVKQNSKQKNDGFIVAEPSEFKKTFEEAKNSIPEDRRWRVSSEYSEDDYKKMRCFVFSGSTVALKPAGKGFDIVSVCAVNGGAKGYQLLEKAVKEGGDRLDAFGEDLYDFYTRNGFEPVSWTPFNEEFAPPEWKKLKEAGEGVAPEPIIFYRYVGKEKVKPTYEEFIKNTEAFVGENGYEEATKARDKEADNEKRRNKKE